MIIYNAEGTTDCKPVNPDFHRSWINFFNSEKLGHNLIMDNLLNERIRCAAAGCEETDLDGCHVVIATEDWEDMERRIDSAINSERSEAAQQMRELMPPTLEINNAKILVRLVPTNWRRAYPSKGIQRPMFITAMCSGCNNQNGAIELKGDSILIPIYDEDQVEI